MTYQDPPVKHWAGIRFTPANAIQGWCTCGWHGTRFHGDSGAINTANAQQERRDHQDDARTPQPV